MAWVRLHDGALTHPKVVGIFDPRRPFDLWMWGLSYSQAHLTDGFIPADALPRGCAKAVQTLIKRGLWHTANGGHKIHDFLDWNDDRETVRKRQQNAKDRLNRFRKRAGEKRVSNTTSGNGERNAQVPAGNQTKPNQTEEEELAESID